MTMQQNNRYQRPPIYKNKFDMTVPKLGSSQPTNLYKNFTNDGTDSQMSESAFNETTSGGNWAMNAKFINSNFVASPQTNTAQMEPRKTNKNVLNSVMMINAKTNMVSKPGNVATSSDGQLGQANSGQVNSGHGNEMI